MPPKDETPDQPPAGLVDRAHARIGDAQAALADRLDAEAERLRGLGPDARVAASGATALETAAYGLREHDLASGIVAADTQVRRTPWAVIGLALAIGTVVGMTLTRGRVGRR
jgi:ElaB/YqjD/DUF883 family membrane-anchored ribosome-binding protein